MGFGLRVSVLGSKGFELRAYMLRLGILSCSAQESVRIREAVPMSSDPYRRGLIVGRIGIWGSVEYNYKGSRREYYKYFTSLGRPLAFCIFPSQP